MVGLKGKDKEVLSGSETENRNPGTLDLDLMSVGELLTVMNEEDKNVIEAVEQALSQIQETVEVIICTLNKGGRLIYAGVRTNGRLRVLDAVECLPTFSITDEVVGIMAGDEEVFVHTQEGVKNFKEKGRKGLGHLKVDERDVVVTLPTSGRIPYCIGTLECAREADACYMGLPCNWPAGLTGYSNIAIEVDTGPEIFTGSTRLRAGTAERMTLNMIFTVAMMGIGKVHESLMVDIRATDLKPVGRTKRIMSMACGYMEETAQVTLELTDGGVKVVIVTILIGMTAKEAKECLEIRKGFVRKCSDSTYGRD